MTSTMPPPVQNPQPGEPPGGRHRRRRRHIARRVAVLMAVLLAWPLFSYGQALTYPGDASVAVRTVEWVRDNGGSPVVDMVESWWFAHPTVGSVPDPASLPPAASGAAVGSTAGASRSAMSPAALPVLAGSAPLPGEGAWTAGQGVSGGAPALYTTFVRPDPDYPGVVAGVARIDQRLTRISLIAGTRQPDGTTAARNAQVPTADRPSLVATFNSGFKMADARGGFFLNGRTNVPLRDGAASLIIQKDGTATVGQWGRDAGAGPDVVAVRQNLALIVDGGQPVPGLDLNAGGTWGTMRNQLQYTWRSGVGVDASGNLIYVGGGNMTLKSLAAALTEAGATRAMQLDIHSKMVDMYSYQHTGGTTTATKLLPDMPNADNRYLVPDQRDFFAVTLRPSSQP